MISVLVLGWKGGNTESYFVGLCGAESCVHRKPTTPDAHDLPIRYLMTIEIAHHRPN